jgi:hypothetical protein
MFCPSRSSSLKILPNSSLGRRRLNALQSVIAGLGGVFRGFIVFYHVQGEKGLLRAYFTGLFLWYDKGGLFILQVRKSI